MSCFWVCLSICVKNDNLWKIVYIFKCFSNLCFSFFLSFSDCIVCVDIHGIEEVQALSCLICIYSNIHFICKYCVLFIRNKELLIAIWYSLLWWQAIIYNIVCQRSSNFSLFGLTVCPYFARNRYTVLPQDLKLAVRLNHKQESTANPLQKFT